MCITEKLRRLRHELCRRCWLFVVQAATCAGPTLVPDDGLGVCVLVVFQSPTNHPQAFAAAVVCFMWGAPALTYCVRSLSPSLSPYTSRALDYIVA